MARVRIYPHNDLTNLAHYHLEVINNKVEKKVEDAITLDCMSCLIALAFSVEAIVNFVGSKKLKRWKEKKPYHEKMAALSKELNFPFDIASEPYKTLKDLKHMRDQLAHGKPVEQTVEVSSKKELQRAMLMPYNEFFTPKFTNHAYEQVIAFEETLLVVAEIPLGETLTSACGSGKLT